MTKIITVDNTVQLATWQKELANAVKNPLQLLQLLDISPESLPLSSLARKKFPMLVPLPFVQKMKKGDIHDPLLKQVLPVEGEELTSEGYSLDPLQEHDNEIPGLLHKYKSRVLLILKSGCAVNCRYCFRRHFPYQDNNINKKQLQEIITYIKAHPDVNEVILSGGDPLMSKDDFLQYLLDQLTLIPQLTRLRIHSRLPVVIPTRITEALCAMLKKCRLQVVFVLHINHANEIDNTFREAMLKLHQAGIQLLNQSVLLKGVNDSSNALIGLSEALFSANILPYYLFLLDKVQGAQHFDLQEKDAQLLVKEMSIALPGYLVPKLSREIAGQKRKTIINSI
ncbi:EF-P beta-lysylation protein EpmB [Psychromonas antarctica]|jgi:EF-P beta-lysylation protein EpmB|uniref:EF-P beta-lysylation protein EpmB n=1 Tax=Psychromonas antarctica TaxID=67573 RepID=UPI001EE78F0E|nr:EF-P beta-lysylation protein EpmB [Psychromonas antarctica]MCG6201737.1 EF-P beta-lysylation protein EpmB [Psychromonas antarctica]